MKELTPEEISMYLHANDYFGSLRETDITTYTIIQSLVEGLKTSTLIYQEEAESIKNLQSRTRPETPYIEIPYFKQDVYDLENLIKVAEYIIP